MNDFILVCFALLFAVTPLFLSVAMRGSVKESRQKLITEIERYFRVEANGAVIAGRSPYGSDDNLLHSLEFIKFKYYLPDTTKKKDEVAIHKVTAHIDDNDFKPDEWMVAAIPLFLLLLSTNVIVGALLAISLDLDMSVSSLSNCFTVFMKAHDDFRYAVIASYIGAYTYMVRSFFQAINNFDLMPASFFGAFNNLIFGVTLPPVLFFSLVEHKTIPAGIVIVTFFVLGYMPDAALRWLLQQSWVKTFKGERSDFGEKGKSVPIEAP